MKGKKTTKYILLSLCISFTGFIAGCFDNGTGPNNDPPFSNLTILNAGHLYVAYPAPLNQTEKLDTVKLSFNYNSSKVSSINVKATLDSGKTWIQVADMASNSSNKASIPWIPKDAALTDFNYFGFKDCWLKISDTGSGESITSDTFQVIGAIPIMLVSPTGGEEYSQADSIKVLYSTNQDITSNVEVCAMAGPDAPDWARDFGTTVRISQTLPIKHFSATFVPQDVAKEKPGYFDFTYPLIILLADYGPNGKKITSGEITIQ